MKTVFHDGSLLLVEHDQAGYAPRTRYNAANADVTVAIALDFNSAGERLTAEAAQGRYLAIPYDGDALRAARRVYAFMRDQSAQSINLAGNSIQRFARGGITQLALNVYLHDLLQLVHLHRPITLVRSGGQTGIDLAALVASVRLGISTVGTLPLGMRQRNAEGMDFEQSPEDLSIAIMRMSDELAEHVTRLA